jgi:hypothetical protein
MAMTIRAHPSFMNLAKAVGGRDFAAVTKLPSRGIRAGACWFIGCHVLICSVTYDIMRLNLVEAYNPVSGNHFRLTRLLILE